MRRPDGITLISIYHFVEAGLFLLGICALAVIPFIVGTSIRYADPPDPGAEVAIPIVTTVIVVVIFALLLLLAANVAVGWGLWNMHAWARLGAIVLSGLRLFNVPIGTVIGGLTIWYLLQPEAMEAFGEAT